MKTCRLSAILILFGIPTFGQNLPDAPKPKVIDKKFVLTMTTLAASATADGITTQRNLNAGGWEANPIFGRHPTAGRLAGVNAAYFGGEVLEAYCLKRWVRNKHLRWIWMIEPIFQTQEHIRFSIHNARLHWAK